MGFYEKAADILARLERREGSIKTMTIGNKRLRPEEMRKMYALICETLKYSSALTTVIERSGLLKSTQLDRRLALVLAHDLLIARGGLHRRGVDKRSSKVIIDHKTRLAAEFAKLKVEMKASSNDDLVPVNLRDSASTFRYVRVNLLKTTVDKTVQEFKDEGYEFLDSSQVERDSLHNVLTPKARKFIADPDLFDLLVFPPGTDLHAHPLYVNGSVILQDKASCMPAHVVRPPPGSLALDACAAPGNKTSHMVSLMGNKGKVFAFDMDKRRLNTLVKLTGNAGCKIITTQCSSFLEINPRDPKYANVKYALLDPSCSGSGIVSRLDALVDSYIDTVNGRNADTSEKAGRDQARLNNLADFQVSIIIHAMKFPSIERISYSTCSIHAEENESVVARILGLQKRFGLASKDTVIPTWPRRGISAGGLTEEQAACVVRTLPEDGTNGFFVAGFVRDNEVADDFIDDLAFSDPKQPILDPEPHHELSGSTKRFSPNNETESNDTRPPSSKRPKVKKNRDSRKAVSINRPSANRSNVNSSNGKGKRRKAKRKISVAAM